MDASSTLETIVNLLRGMYTCHGNTERRELTLKLLAFEERLESNTLAATGVGLFGLGSEGAAVQAYGAVLLRNGLRARKITVRQIPLMDLLTWYCNEPQMSGLICEDLRKLMVECVYCAEDNLASRILEILLAQTDLSASPRQILLLHAVVVACVDPDYDHVDRSKLGALKRGITAKGEALLACMSTTLFSLYNAAGGAGCTILPVGTEDLLEACFGVLSSVAPALPFDMWRRAGLADTIIALLRWQPTQRLAAMASAALIRTGDTADEGRRQVLQDLLAVVLESLGLCVATRDIGLIDEIIALLKDTPKTMIASVSVSICHSLVHILSIPSIWFAEQVCATLLSLQDSANALREISVADLYPRILQLSIKHQCDPDTGSDPEGVALSQEQLGFSQLYKQTFDSFRSLSGKLVRCIALHHPVETNQYILHLLLSLCDSAGTVVDERTRSGYVTQRSNTFLTWEATAWLIDNLAVSFSLSAQYVPECIAALQERHPTDAVLTPLYLNVLSTFWRCRPDAADDTLNIWSGTLDILFRYTEERRTIGGDPDDDAAHRRAHTLLVTACSEHALHMGHAVAGGCLERIKTNLFSATGVERSLLYECAMSLIAALPPVDAAPEFGALLDPILSLLSETALPLTQDGFNAIILGVTPESRDTREPLRTSIDILSAVFRRSQRTPYVFERLNVLVSVLAHLILLLHGMQPAALPPQFRSILEQSEAEREQFMPGMSRRSDAHLRKLPVDLARTALLSLRVTLYQLVGAVCRLIPTEQVADMLRGVLLASEAALPIHHVRALTERCLFPVGESHPDLLSHILSLISSFFSMRQAAIARELQRAAVPVPQARQTKGVHQASSQSARGAQADVVQERQWFYYTKDIMTFVKTKVLLGSAWHRNPGLFSAAASLAVCVLESGCDTRNAFYFSLNIMDLRAQDAPAGAVGADALIEVQGQLYTRVLAFTIAQLRAPSSASNPPKEIDSMVYAATGPYIRLVPHMGGCFVALGVPHDTVVKLHAQLGLCNNDGMKRRKVKEFIVGLASSLPL